MYSTTLAGYPASPNITQPISTESPDAKVSRDVYASPDTASPDQDRLQDIADVIEFCKAHGFPADVVGRWVWIRFDEKPDQATRDILKAAGFRWVKIRGQWAHNCGYHSRRGKGNPRWKYGSVPVSVITSDDLRELRGVA